MRESTQEEIDMEAQLAAARNLRSALEDKEQDAPFAEDEMREPTQEEIDKADKLAARNLQYTLEDEEQLIEQVRPHPHLFIFPFELSQCWGKHTRHQHRTMKRHLKYCP
jgi:hypothetical protein